MGKDTISIIFVPTRTWMSAERNYWKPWAGMMQNWCEIMRFGSLSSRSLLILSSHLFQICAIPLTSLEIMRVHVHITDSLYLGFIDPAWVMIFQGGGIQSAPAQLHSSSLYVCVSGEFVSILFCCDRNRKAGCWAGQFARDLVVVSRL